METKNFKVKENGLKEFSDRYIVYPLEKDGRDNLREMNPFYILGTTIVVRKSIMDVIESDPVIEFKIYYRSRQFNIELVNTYLYSIEENDALTLKLELIDFKVEDARYAK